MKIIKYLISLLEPEFDLEKDKVYSEEELKQFAEKAKLLSIIAPWMAFAYAVKAKKSKNPDIVKKAEKVEMVTFFIGLLIYSAIIIITIGNWIFSGIWLPLLLALVLTIAVIVFIVFKIVKKRIIDK
jgi:hypothetical protein